MDNVSKSNASNAPKRSLESKMTAATLMTTNELQASKTVFSTKELQTLNNMQANGDQTFKIVSEMPQGFLIRKRRKAGLFTGSFHRQFFILDASAQLLHRFDKEQSGAKKEIKNTIDLSKLKSLAVVKQAGAKFTFTLVGADGDDSPNGEIITIAAYCAYDFKRWISSFRELLSVNEFKRPSNDDELDQMFALLLDELALPAPVQKQMMSQQT